MGNVIFLFFHVLAILLFPIALVVTLPLHLIHLVSSGDRAREAGGPSKRTHTRCPECREFILKGARLCKHCGTRLAPEEAPRAEV